ncbi:MAG: L,D-transpeptidase [Desulfitobacteriaceae bacterium]
MGKAGTPTPVGRFAIADKRLDPGGVFGSRWLGLSKPGYGIHGTNDPSSIGKAVSKGCIRMYNYHAEELFRNVEVGTPVIIEL